MARAETKGAGGEGVTIIDCVQRSPQWVSARLGRLTASCASDMLTTRKDRSEAAGRRNLRIRLVLERITGKPQESDYQSAAMLQGMEREADAAGLYEALTGRILSSVGFCQHDTLMAGCSPDGYVGDFEGIVEVKSPIPATHWDYLKSGVIPGEYEKQILCALWITGAQWCDWLSYNPDFPEPLRVKLVRVERKQVDCDAFELAVRQFLREVEAECAQLAQMAGVAA
jgi:hypothetical protein